MFERHPLPLLFIGLAVPFTTTIARADTPLGAPPPDATALVAAPKAAEDVPTLDAKANDELTGTLSAGGQYASGNSRLLAGTANGKFDIRRGEDAFSASLLANYGQSAQPGADWVETSGNVQGRVRYDRYFGDRFSLFLIATGRNDKFQGLDFRLNLDPGVKYLVVKTDSSAIWGEAGYDFQYDDRLHSALIGYPGLSRTDTLSSLRLFAGLKHAFNPKVTFSTGLEYLQSLEADAASRINYDALFAAEVGGGLAVGLGFSARYDYGHLPGKKDTDTTTTVSLIYAFHESPPVNTPPAAPVPPPAPPPASAPPPPSYSPAAAPPSAAPGAAPAPAGTAPAPSPGVTPAPSAPPPVPPAQ